MVKDCLLNEIFTQIGHFSSGYHGIYNYIIRITVNAEAHVANVTNTVSHIGHSVRR